MIITVRPSMSRLKVECRIYPTRKDMLAATRKFIHKRYNNVGKTTAAYCEGTKDLLPSKQHLAVVFFNKNDLTHGIIAHEFDHVANCLMYRWGYRTLPVSIDEATEIEEKHCYIVQDLVDAFHKRFSI